MYCAMFGGSDILLNSLLKLLYGGSIVFFSDKRGSASVSVLFNL